MKHDLPFPDKVLDQHISDFTLFPSFSPIVRRLFWCCPAAIAWLVVSIVIFPIKRMETAGTMPHVCQKNLEIVSPSNTNRYPSPAILLIIWRPSVIASILHSFPNVIFDCRTQAMGSIGGGCSFALEAPTRNNLFSKMILPNHFVISAFTKTSPKSMPAILFAKSNDKEPAESSANQHCILTKFHSAKVKLWGV